jgi:hypothetical protein
MNSFQLLSLSRLANSTASTHRRPSSLMPIATSTARLRITPSSRTFRNARPESPAVKFTAGRAAEEDSGDYYVRGFYPTEKDLDGKKHQLTLDVSKKLRARRDLAVQYRQEYFHSRSTGMIKSLARRDYPHASSRAVPCRHC